MYLKSKHKFHKGVNKLYSNIHNEIRVSQLKVYKELKPTII